MSLGRAPFVLAAVLLGSTAAAGAQEVPPALSGRLDAVGVWSQAAPEALTGLATGWAGLTAGTATVKTEVRLTVASQPAPGVGLGRAWMKFRQPGWRVTAGYGRIGWGPGFVFVPGDLLNDSTSGPADWSADELRSEPGWLADGWVGLGDEAFAEAAAKLTAAGVRFSAAPFGLTLEASGLWDQPARRASGALSLQGPFLGLDWYATGRTDFETRPGTSAGRASAGVFGLWRPAEGWTVSSRHEALGGTDRPAETWRSYHDLTVALDAWSVTGRGLSGPAWSSWSGSGAVDWAVFQGLTLRASATVTEPRAVSLGATSRW